MCLPCSQRWPMKSTKLQSQENHFQLQIHCNHVETCQFISLTWWFWNVLNLHRRGLPKGCILIYLSLCLSIYLFIYRSYIILPYLISYNVILSYLVLSYRSIVFQSRQLYSSFQKHSWCSIFNGLHWSRATAPCGSWMPWGEPGAIAMAAMAQMAAMAAAEKIRRNKAIHQLGLSNNWQGPKDAIRMPSGYEMRPGKMMKNAPENDSVHWSYWNSWKVHSGHHNRVTWGPNGILMNHN